MTSIHRLWEHLAAECLGPRSHGTPLAAAAHRCVSAGATIGLCSRRRLRPGAQLHTRWSACAPGYWSVVCPVSRWRAAVDDARHAGPQRPMSTLRVGTQIAGRVYRCGGPAPRGTGEDFVGAALVLSLAIMTGYGVDSAGRGTRRAGAASYRVSSVPHPVPDAPRTPTRFSSSVLA